MSKRLHRKTPAKPVQPSLFDTESEPPESSAQDYRLIINGHDCSDRMPRTRAYLQELFATAAKVLGGHHDK